MSHYGEWKMLFPNRNEAFCKLAVIFYFQIKIIYLFLA